MTKTEFKDLLLRYANSTRQEADQVLSLEKQYPYSQVLHSLAARLSKDHGLESQQFELQLAAVYAADRHVLKEIMSSTFTPGINKTSPQTINSTIDAIDYADEVIHDLELLHELKHNFEMLFIDFPKKGISPVKNEITSVKPTKTASHKSSASKAKKSAPSKKKVVSKTKEKVKASLRKKGAKPATKTIAKSTTAGKRKKAKPVKKKLKNGDDLLSEIEATKRKLRLDSPKQREQIQLIDQFIKTQPSISNARDRVAMNAPAGDLTPFKQGEFGDQIISETLVSILIRQGKKEKAVEVLKKLIWKFPQKKAYFAAQIEELKK